MRRGISLATLKAPEAAVPLAIAAGFPVALLQVSLLAAVLSLLLSAALVCLAVLMGREAAAQTRQARRAEAVLAAIYAVPETVTQPGSRS